MTAVHDLMNGRFESAIKGYKKELLRDPNDPGAVAGMGSALLGAARYAEAIPFLEREDEAKMLRNPESCGLKNDLAYAHWCIGEREIGIGLMSDLCAGLKKGTIKYATDVLGGGEFGLILYFMAVTLSDEARLKIAIGLLKKLSDRQHRKYANPDIYPIGAADYALGLTDFDGMIRTTTEGLSLNEALKAQRDDRSVCRRLGMALFSDGAFRRHHGDEAGCLQRMREVYALGYRTNGACWALARDALQVR